MEDCGRREISGQETAGVGKDGTGIDDVKAEEGDGPNAVEYLEKLEREKTNVKQHPHCLESWVGPSAPLSRSAHTDSPKLYTRVYT